jgi:hypothetical protein
MTLCGLPAIELPSGLTRRVHGGTAISHAQGKSHFYGHRWYRQNASGHGYCALKACQEGRRVRFYTAACQYPAGEEQQRYAEQLSLLKKVELIVIDEIGFVPLHKDAAELLFQVI